MCLRNGFQKRLAFELVDWEKHMALPDVGKPHSVHWGLSGTRRQRKGRENSYSLSASLHELGHQCSLALGLGLDPPAFLGVRLANSWSWDFLAFRVKWANSSASDQLPGLLFSFPPLSWFQSISHILAVQCLCSSSPISANFCEMSHDIHNRCSGEAPQNVFSLSYVTYSDSLTYEFSYNNAYLGYFLISSPTSGPINLPSNNNDSKRH